MAILPSMRTWFDANCSPKPKPAKKLHDPKLRTPCTELDLAAIKAIGRVTYVPATPAKRFARDMQGKTELTHDQRRYLWDIAFRFRRQIKDIKVRETAMMINQNKKSLIQ